MITVFGATGQTGREVTRQLAAKGVSTRALIRNPQKAQLLAGLGVEIAQPDLEQPDTLEAALRGAERAYFVTSGEATRLSPNSYAAAKSADVRHVVRLSGSFMVRKPHGVRFDEWHHQAELNLERSGLAWTHHVQRRRLRASHGGIGARSRGLDCHQVPTRPFFPNGRHAASA